MVVIRPSGQYVLSAIVSAVIFTVVRFIVVTVTLHVYVWPCVARVLAVVGWLMPMSRQ